MTPPAAAKPVAVTTEKPASKPRDLRKTFVETFPGKMDKAIKSIRALSKYAKKGYGATPPEVEQIVNTLMDEVETLQKGFATGAVKTGGFSFK